MVALSSPDHGIILVVQGQRKIPVQYAKRVVGNKVMVARARSCR